jgi:hypothetical protein
MGTSSARLTELSLDSENVDHDSIFASNIVNTMPHSNQRDIGILHMILVYDGCTIEQIRRRFFPSPGARSACYRRVALLVDRGYLRSTRLMTLPADVFGKAFVTIGPAAREWLRCDFELSAAELAHYRKRLVPRFAAHDLAIGDFHLHLELATEQSSRISLESWIAEWQLRRQPLTVIDPQTNRLVPVIPDASFTLRLEGTTPRSQEFALELDMDSYPDQRRFCSKLRAHLVNAQLTQVPVLFVAASRRRAAAIARFTLEQAAKIRANPTWIWVATREQLSPQTVLCSPVWQLPGEENLQPMLPAFVRLGTREPSAATPATIGHGGPSL